MKILLRICLLLGTVCCESFAQVVIDGIVGDTKYSEIKYYKPFKESGNHQIPSYHKLSGKQTFNLKLDIAHPSLAEFHFGDQVLWLFLEPKDSIHVNVFNAAPWFEVTGANAKGQEYYSLVYNYNLMQKFEGVRVLFKEHYTESVPSIQNYLKQELERQTNWLDSLYQAKLVSLKYKQYMKAEIEGGLAWEIGNLCDKYYGDESRLDLLSKGHLVKAALFKLVDPLNEKIRFNVRGQGYYQTYFEEVYKVQKPLLDIDTAKVIIDDLAYLELAPAEIKEYEWARAIINYKTFAPDLYDLCKAYKKYKNLYPVPNEYTAFLDSSDICADRIADKHNYKIVNDNSADFFSFIASNFPGRRLYIDLWATWCIPCKAEFPYYNKRFYDKLDERNIKILFISIDDKERTAAWSKAIEVTNLKGYHVLAGKRLQASLKEIVYNSGPTPIPRYLLINEKGQILSVNAKRPSDTLLENELDVLFGPSKTK